MKSKLSDKWFYILILILGIYFLIRLIDQSKLMWVFPLDYTNDLSSYMAFLFFFIKYGFREFIPHWYNGFILFKLYPPGWIFFTTPLYYLTKSIIMSTYLSLISMFILSFIFLFLLGKSQKISLIKIIAFFLILFANPISIGNFLRLGRVTSLFGWVIFLGLAVLMLHYKDKIIDKKFILFFIPIYFILMISHFSEMIISHFLILSLFLTKRIKGKLIIVFCAIIGLILSAPIWWFSFIVNMGKSGAGLYKLSERLLEFSGPWLWTNIASIIIPLVLFTTFYFYYKSKYNSKKELLFFSPILVLALLFITRLIIYVPIFNRIYPDEHMTFYIFFALFFFFKTKFKVYSNLIKKLLFIGLILVPILFVIISVVHTPFFIVPGDLEKETLSIFPMIEGKFLILESPSYTSYPNAYYAIGPIYYNLSTSAGWMHFLVSPEYDRIIRGSIQKNLKDKNCMNLLQELHYTNTTDVITYDLHCGTLKECGLKEVIRKNHVCLFVTNN